ncbi:hypothetical protein SPONN_1303 [uncultured Candidatus Thioglobus sp.]|nr:hypothetical protein SPONN_1303 [uncultured Candidatus Thioglobus sp.]
MLNEIKISQVAGYILSKEDEQTMSILKLMKLLYFVDRLSLEKYGEPVSFDNIVVMPHGMVLSQTYNLSSGASPSIAGGWDEWISDKENHNISLNKDIKNIDEFDELSIADIELVDEVYSKYGQYNGFELADMHHNNNICPEWSDPKGSSFGVSYEDIFIAMGRDKDEIKALLERIEESKSLLQLFH